MDENDFTHWRNYESRSHNTMNRHVVVYIAWLRLMSWPDDIQAQLYFE